MPAIQAARPAATRPWRERLWEQDDWAWLLALLVALLTIRLVVPPRNQFEITHPFTASAPEPLLYVTLVTGKTSVPKHFDTVKKL